MSTRSSLIVQIVLLIVWTAASYAVRFYLMENVQWLELCDSTPDRLECSLRSGMGLAIHFGVLAWAAIVLAIPAYLIKGNSGRVLAWASLACAIPALVLYTVTLAVFALLIAALRLIRTERHSANVSSAEAPAQPSA